MTKNEVLKRLCCLCTHISEEQFGLQEPADCFCGRKASPESTFQFSEKVLSFLEQCVRESEMR